MKKILSIFLVLVSLSLFGQESDENYELQDFSILSPVQSQIVSARGWSMQDNGKWAYSDNRIPYTDSRTNTIRKPAVDQLGLDNFISIEMYKIMIDDQQYNILIKKYIDGEYEFQYLAKGWKSYNSLDYYVFKSDKLFELMPEEVPFNTMYLVDLECFYVGKIRNYEKTVTSSRGLKLTNYATGAIESFPSSKDGDYTDIIIKTIQDVKSGLIINDGNLIFAVYPIKSGEKEVARFKFIKTYNNDNLIKLQTSPDNWTNLFDNFFYEVPFSTFRSFIEDSRSYYVSVEKEISAYTTHYNWGVLRYQIGDYLGATEAFYRALEEDPDAPDFMIYAYLGNALSKSGKYFDAIAFFDKAIELKPTRVMDYSNWVKNYFNRGVAKYYLDRPEDACIDWKKSYDLGYGSASEYLNDFCGRNLK
ncbi:MAG: tetratricopeptide repeat protein [Bacteroidetes bacterium]|jgi:tetratricopeptide (TPR) repeat protein|nr:tetratricopeptide repeat protein [Bacteroidota bacterium]